jgi:hypothetical protein
MSFVVEIFCDHGDSIGRAAGRVERGRLRESLSKLRRPAWVVESPSGSMPVPTVATIGPTAGDRPRRAAGPGRDQADVRDFYAQHEGAGRFERSRDGVTWEPVEPEVMRRHLAGYYRAAEPCLTAMVEHGQTIRTPFVRYRYNASA